MQRFTHFVMVDNRVRAGAYSLTDAEKMAQLLGGRVEEAIIATIEGELRISGNHLFVDNQPIGDALLDEMGITLPTKTSSYDLGYCSVLIKPTKTAEDDGVES